MRAKSNVIEHEIIGMFVFQIYNDVTMLKYIRKKGKKQKEICA